MPLQPVLLIRTDSPGVSQLGKTLEEMREGVGSSFDPLALGFLFSLVLQKLQQALHTGFQCRGVRPFASFELELLS
jgi:hypothetical protein